MLNEQIHVPLTSFALDGDIDYDQLLEGTKSLLDCGNLPAQSMGKFSNANTLLHHGRTKVKGDADKMQVLCGGLDAFLDFEKSSSILLPCLSQISISVLIMLNVGANNRMQNFVFNLFGSYKAGKQQEVIQKYLDLFLLLHGPKIRDADNAVQLFSEGFFNLLQQLVSALSPIC